MENSNKPAFPTDEYTVGAMGFDRTLGLTKLEYASIMAMQGILASDHSKGAGFDSIAKHAIIAAKELLYQLNNETNGAK